MYSQFVQFTFARKGYDNHYYHNKPPNRKWAGVWMRSCPVEMVPRSWGFWKRVSWELWLDHGGRESWVSAVEDVVGVLLISTDRDLKHHNMRRVLGIVSIVRIVSLSSCRKTEVRNSINRSYLNNRVRLYCICICLVSLVFCICKCVRITVVIDMVIGYNTMSVLDMALNNLIVRPQ